MKNITIKFKHKSVILSAVEHNGKLFYNLSDVYDASGENRRTYSPDKWKHNLSKKYQDAGDLVKLKVDNRWVCLSSEHWHGTEDVVYAYAARISPDFSDLLYRTFKHVVNGESDEALKLANTVASLNRL